LGHGIKDLSPADQAAILKQRQDAFQVHTVTKAPAPVAEPEVEVRYVRVPETDYAGEGFRQALAAEANVNPQLLQFIDRIQRNAKVFANGLRSKKRMTGEGPEPPEIVVTAEEKK
jgi:hypothetical protein